MFEVYDCTTGAFMAKVETLSEAKLWALNYRDQSISNGTPHHYYVAEVKRVWVTKSLAEAIAEPQKVVRSMIGELDA